MLSLLMKERLLLLTQEYIQNTDIKTVMSLQKILNIRFILSVNLKMRSKTFSVRMPK